MKTFNTVTIHEVTDDFGNFEKFRAILNQGAHEYHVTDIAEAKKMSSIVEFVTKNWSSSEIIFGDKI